LLFYKYAATTKLGLKEVPASLSLVCGASAGATATLITYPLDLLRTRLAAQSVPPVYTSITHAVKSIYQTGGVKGFYHGICPSLWQFVPYVGIQFFVYDGLHKVLKNNGIDAGTLGHGMCGATAGLTAKLITFPFDVSKKRLQIRGMNMFRSGLVPGKCPSFVTMAKLMYEEEGFGVFYKGLIPSLLKSATQAALIFTLVEVMKKSLTKDTSI